MSGGGDITARRLLRAWGALLALSAAAIALSVLGVPVAPRIAGAAILLACWLKARVILGDYLGLAAAPAWRRGFDVVTALFVLLLAGLFLAAGMGMAAGPGTGAG